MYEYFKKNLFIYWFILKKKKNYNYRESTIKVKICEIYIYIYMRKIEVSFNWIMNIWITFRIKSQIKLGIEIRLNFEIKY